MKKIIVHYPFIAKYRIPIFKLLNSSKDYKYIFWADNKNNDKYFITDTKGLRLEKVTLKEISLPFISKIIEWQPFAIFKMMKDDIDVYIVLANPNSISTWLCLFIAKFRKKTILMWSHGFLTNETGLKGKIRELFYSIADGHLLYGNKAKEIMTHKGFKNEKLFVIYNSLDYILQTEYRNLLTYNDFQKSRKDLGINENDIVLITIGRLMSKLKIEQVIKAIQIQLERGMVTHLIIVGDGPERKNLKNLCKELKVIPYVHFYGLCHEEKELSLLYNMSTYSVVMGKVGLSAMHSLAYGIPMITNNNIDLHFPEIEAIVEEKTGFYFKEDDIEDFCHKLQPISYRSNLYVNCINKIEEKYTPENQKTLIENAIKQSLERLNK